VLLVRLRLMSENSYKNKYGETVKKMVSKENVVISFYFGAFIFLLSSRNLDDHFGNVKSIKFAFFSTFPKFYSGLTSNRFSLAFWIILRRPCFKNKVDFFLYFFQFFCILLMITFFDVFQYLYCSYILAIYYFS